ncbi:MAG: protein-export chaperone SecB [Pseudomonadota bacterium]
MAEQEKTPPMVINTQYIKDLSFENPNAPAIYAAMTQNAPDLNIAIDVTPVSLNETTYEVALSLRAEATVGETSAFLTELEYAGIVTLSESLSEEEKTLSLMVEAPRHLFPFARAIIAGATRDGGFPPLVVNPIDFYEFYKNRQNESAEATENGAEESPSEDSA